MIPSTKNNSSGHLGHWIFFQQVWKNIEVSLGLTCSLVLIIYLGAHQTRHDQPVKRGGCPTVFSVGAASP